MELQGIYWLISFACDWSDLCGAGLEFRDLHGSIVLAAAADLELLPAGLGEGVARGERGECVYGCFLRSNEGYIQDVYLQLILSTWL